MVKRAQKQQRRPARTPARTLDDIPDTVGDLPELTPEDLAELQQFARARRDLPDWRGPGEEPGGGRPRRPDDQIKASRYGLRLHADLRKELDRLAHHDGLLLSVWLQRLLVETVNSRYRHEVLDWFGRYRRTAPPRR
jgi:hypothetical protein